MGQGVRSAIGEASTSSSAERASFESLSPPDPSLIVIGSPRPQNGRARGLPPALGGEAPRPALATGGWTPPPMDEARRSRHPSAAEEWRSL